MYFRLIRDFAPSGCFSGPKSHGFAKKRKRLIWGFLGGGGGEYFGRGEMLQMRSMKELHHHALLSIVIIAKKELIANPPPRPVPVC